MSPSNEAYDRDLIGYGANPVDPKWPGGARVALQISLAYETGGEENPLHGDARSEGMLTDIGWPAVEGGRSVLVEQIYEYGSRRGVWRLLRIFAERGVKVGVLAVGAALERNPEVAAAIVEAGHEVVCHGYRWIDYQHLPEAIEREYVRRGVESITRATGSRPLGWMTGRPGPNTRRLVVEEGGFVYDPGHAQRRAALLGHGRRPAPPRDPVLIRMQRFGVQRDQRLQYRRGVLHLPQGRLRHVLCRRRIRAQDDVDGGPRSDSRPSRPRGRPRPLSRLRA